MEVKSPAQSHLRQNRDVSSVNQAMEPEFLFTAGDNSLGYLLGPKLIYCCAAKAYLRQGNMAPLSSRWCFSPIRA